MALDTGPTPRIIPKIPTSAPAAVLSGPYGEPYKVDVSPVSTLARAKRLLSNCCTVVFATGMCTRETEAVRLL